MRCTFLLVLLALAFCEVPADLPRIPLYTRSYHLLEGNPLTDQVDPGFMSGIFAFTYNQNETTEDGKYRVPDGMNHRKVASCAFSSTVKTYRGTASYQQELQKKVTIDGGYRGLVVGAAFSSSASYDIMAKETIETNMSFTHAMAECEAYEFSVDLFKELKLLDNFVKGVKDCYKSGNWTNFWKQFGTHFIYEVTMGGRATQEMGYNFEAASQMSALNIDISLAAKAHFAMHYADASYDWKKSIQEITYASRFSSRTLEMYIGGAPPTDGNIHTWAQNVAENPMPIKYKIMDLAELFQHIRDVTFDSKKAVEHFRTALDKHCMSIGCKPALPDNPEPAPAQNTYSKTEDLGGHTIGAVFEYAEKSTTMNLKKVLIRWSRTVTRIQFMLSDGVKNIYTPIYGNDGGTDLVW